MSERNRARYTRVAEHPLHTLHTRNFLKPDSCMVLTANLAGDRGSAGGVTFTAGLRSPREGRRFLVQRLSSGDPALDPCQAAPRSAPAGSSRSMRTTGHHAARLALPSEGLHSQGTVQVRSHTAGSPATTSGTSARSAAANRGNQSSRTPKGFRCIRALQRAWTERRGRGLPSPETSCGSNPSGRFTVADQMWLPPQSG
jgi:hypothetical protein